MRDSAGYTVGFAAVVCVVCSVVVASSAVSLRDKQTENKALFRQQTVLAAAGLIEPGEKLGKERIQQLFTDRVRTERIDIETGKQDADGANELVSAPENNAGLINLPTHAEVYFVQGTGDASTLVLPVEGKGLWSTLKGFLALDAGDLNTVRGIEFYEHGETPGLGGEIDNPRWKALFPGRKAFDESGDPALHVARGEVGPPEQDPYEVDALTGATLTSRGVTNMIHYWLGANGYGPLFERLEKGGDA